ncbi:MAG TPA: zinc ribbon domain-containing protein [Vicinamibacterales bacterium]|nr:zinc ribbon domain-containing protein [Vicinamibacterales bacterium]
MSSATLSESGRTASEPPASALPKPGDASALRPGHFFTGATLAVAAAAVVVLRGSSFVEMVLALFTIGGAGLAAFALYTMLAPLTATRVEEGLPLVEGRTRAALERDKALTLRSLKELEFDRAMGKIAEADFQEMRARLRARAVRLIQQLEGASTYRERIERDLREMQLPAFGQAAASSPACAECGTANDEDARFCKMCGHALR